MTDITYSQAKELPEWADWAVDVWAGKKLVTLYFSLVNIATEEYYVGAVFHEKPRLAELRAMRKEFQKHAPFNSFNALIETTDLCAQKFAEFFGFQNTHIKADETHLVFRRDF